MAPKVDPAQTNFNAGEFSPRAQGRSDLERYKAALDLCDRWVPSTQGALVRCPGTYFISENGHIGGLGRLIPFQFSTTQAYMILAYLNGFRFFKDRAPITLASQNITGATQASPIVITCVGHGYSNGDYVLISSVSGMTTINNREFLVAGVTADTFQLKDFDGNNINGTSYPAYTSGGTVAKIYTISNGYTNSLDNIRYVQSADVLYMVNGSNKVKKITRTAHTSWTCTDIDLLDGPYLPTNETSTTLTPGAASGSGVSLTASASLFVNGDIGRPVRILYGSNWGWGRIASVGSATSATIDIISNFGATTAATSWRLGVYSGANGYPRCITFFEDRLWLGGADAYPQRFDGSMVGDYEDFAPSTNSNGTVTDAHAVGFTLNAADVDVLRWMKSDERGMIAGTVANEWTVRASTQGEALTPTNVSAKKTTNYGSAYVDPVQVGSATLFLQYHGRKLREAAFSVDSDGYIAPDLSVLAENITQSGGIQMAHQRNPYSIVWMIKNDGALVALSYERDIDNLKVAWHRHTLGGSYLTDDPQVLSIACIPATHSLYGHFDELWMIVRRTINGSTKYYIEVLTKFFDEEDEQNEAFFVDCGLSLNNPKTVTGATNANPIVITSNSHGFSNGDTVIFENLRGMTELNDQQFTVANVAANTFELSGEDGTSYGTFVATSDAYVRKYVSSISGLYHLEGQSVAICVDGAYQAPQTVSLGALTLPNAGAVVHIGLQYNSDARTLRLDAGSATGTAMGKIRRTHRVGLNLDRTNHLNIGPSFDDLEEVIFREGGDLSGRAIPLYSGIKSEEFEADYDFDNKICIRASKPLPATILAIYPQMVTQDRG